MRDGPERLDGRAGQIWSAYVAGRTQEAIAAEYGITQQRVSQVLADVRVTIPDAVRMDAALLAAERVDALLAAVWPAAMEGDVRAVAAALKVLERSARALGTDAAAPLQLVLERRLDDEGEAVAAAVVAALDALSLTEEQRVTALGAAQASLLGEPLPDGPQSADGPPTPSRPGGGATVLERDVRAMLEADGINVDELDDDGQEDGDGD